MPAGTIARVRRLAQRSSLAVVALALLLAAGVASTSSAQVDYVNPLEVHFFAADTSQIGVVSLYFFGALGAPVTFYERIDGNLVKLGTRTTAKDPTGLVDAVPWRCDRLVRSFVATAPTAGGKLAAGAYSVRTSSCATRFDLAVPRRVQPGAVARVRVIDRWGNGAVTPTLCIRPPRGERTCTKQRLRRAVSTVTRRFRATAPGRWRIELRYRGHTVRRTVAVGADARATAPPPTVLATGDSTMQGIDRFLADELADGATLESDVRPGTGIVKPLGPWGTLARRQTRRLHQAVTVVSLGVVDNFPVTTAAGIRQECCGPGWVAEYTARVRAMMRTYRRDGRGRVFWLTLPIPRGPRDVADAVNTSVVQAANGLDGVTVMRMDLFFTPTGFRDRMPYRGRVIDVREEDGIHLNLTGSAIAAKLVADAIRTR
jgi:hypothetical protein